MEIPNEIVERVLREVVDRFLKPKFIELGMNASGTWLNSLEVRGNEIWGMDYTEYLATGRGINDDQSEEGINHFTRWAGYYIFKPWVEAKGLSINPYYVARKIAKEGTNNYPDGTDLMEVLESREVKEFITSELSQYVIMEVKQKFVRQAKQILT